MAVLIDQFRMETNYEGLIQLLARSLYHEPEAFVRELIQNGHDSIIRRCDLEKNHAGRIDITCDPKGRVITFRDNGIGMDKADIREFLSVIGSTGTGSARRTLAERGREAAEQLIGQFGIGMLSAFVVAEEVIVRTRKLGAEAAFSWHNRGSADCQLFSDERQDVGTDIEVIINSQNAFMLSVDRLRDAIVKYCDFIPFEIYLNGEGPVNLILPPWHRMHWSSPAEKDASYRLFLRRRFRDFALDVIPFEFNEPFRARGVLYISDRHVPDMNTTGVMDVFVRRMFVVGGDNTLLPKWAKFIRGVIDSPDLQPTAARDNIQRKHPSFSFFQARLGELIVERLKYLSQHEGQKFAQINQWHHYHLKGMAYYHEDFFAQVADMLLFETNRGLMPLKEYVTKNGARASKNNRVPIFYFSYYGAAGQFYRLANARAWVVINAGRNFDEELLVKYGEHNRMTVYLERLDVSDDAELFQRIEEAEHEGFRQLEVELEGYLHRAGISNVAVQMRRFVPAELPAVIVLTPESEASEKLREIVSQPWMMDIAGDIAKEALKQTQRMLYLSLNADNPIVKRLAGSDRTGVEAKCVMLGIYNSAILYSHSLLTYENVNAIHEQVVRLFDLLMTNREMIINLTQSLEKERRRALELHERQVELSIRRPDHVLIFMITPFASTYQSLERAVRRVFERQPYCFEVRLARDYTHKPGLLDNLREHMIRAHGFIADVTELNPNVMFELGAAMMPSDGRLVFTLRCADATLPVPADFKEKLLVPYGQLTDPPEVLEASLRAAFERDGRITHDGILALIAQRTRRFLSRALLESLEVKLTEVQMVSLMKKYTTIEELVESAPEEVARSSSIQSWKIPAIQEPLREVLGS